MYMCTLESFELYAVLYTSTSTHTSAMVHRISRVKYGKKQLDVQFFSLAEEQSTDYINWRKLYRKEN